MVASPRKTSSPVAAHLLSRVDVSAMRSRTAGQRRRRAPRWMAWVALVAAGVAVIVAAARSTNLTAADAALLGLVEGITEYLPVSSTGHLTVVQRLLGIGTSDADKRAADAYAICIQAGAIVAVLLVYRQRLRSILAGAVGRDDGGRRLLGVLLASFAPAAVLGVGAGDLVQKSLFGVGPVVAAWAVGGVVILTVGRRCNGGLRSLAMLTYREAAVVGVAQALALWPGVSRSFVTILAGLVLGLSAAAAVEYSFLLGVVTLGAATAAEATSDGAVIVDAYGIATPMIGLATAFVAAVAAVRWLVAYLERHGLVLFGWYRLAVAAMVASLMVAGVL